MESSFINKYKKIKIVGKGSSGTAFLCERLSDHKFVVIKEINMMDLSDGEREMALNEVRVLSVLNHPNIISYYGSMERNGMLLIEMEYANHGTLGQLLNKFKTESFEFTFTDRMIYDIFIQIVAAIVHIHSNNILHRDMKTANIFLNSKNEIKIGDFGLSKLMSTRAWTDTVLGTPFYLSPEMCVGEEYNEKSDIWALGCILYEMITLNKPFQASNLTALVKKITEDPYPPLDNDKEIFEGLVGSMLQKKPGDRPTAQEISDKQFPNLLQNIQIKENNLRNLFLTTTRERTILYFTQTFKDELNLQPINLPLKEILDLVISETHCLCLTKDKIVYKWPNEPNGNTLNTCPRFVQPLLGKSIIGLAAGNGYSLFLTATGEVLIQGRLSISTDTQQNLRKVVISVTVNEIKSGNHHMIALSNEGEIFSWGQNINGCLGLGEPLENSEKPTKLTLPVTKGKIVKIFCGPNASGCLDITGTLYVCGSNAYNKLTPNRNIEFISKFSQVQFVLEGISSVEFGENHTAILTTSGRIMTLGNNEFGQLGHGHTNKSSPKFVEALRHKRVIEIACGLFSTGVFTDDNIFYLWGRQFSISGEITPNFNYLAVKEDSGDSRFDDLASPVLTEVQLKPKPVLALFSSPEHVSEGNFVRCQFFKIISPATMIIGVFSSTPLPNTTRPK